LEERFLDLEKFLSNCNRFLGYEEENKEEDEDDWKVDEEVKSETSIVPASLILTSPIRIVFSVSEVEAQCIILEIDRCLRQDMISKDVAILLFFFNNMELEWDECKR